MMPAMFPAPIQEVPGLRPREALTAPDRDAMFALLSRHFAGTGRDEFEQAFPEHPKHGAHLHGMRPRRPRGLADERDQDRHRDRGRDDHAAHHLPASCHRMPPSIDRRS